MESCRDTQKTQHGIETSSRMIPHPTATGRDTQKTQHGIETFLWPLSCSLTRWVETLRKPSTGLKLVVLTVARRVDRVETLRKPSTGLKHT